MGEIGNNIRALRLKHNLTLKQVSEKIGTSIGYLSQVERGNGTIDIQTAMRLSEIYNVDISSLLNIKKEDEKCNLVRSHERRLFQTSDGFSSYVMSVNPEKMTVMLYIFDIFPFCGNDVDAPFYHYASEYIYVIEGRLTITVEQEKHILCPGDTIFIEPLKKHSWYNETPATCKILSIVNLNEPHLENDGKIK